MKVTTTWKVEVVCAVGCESHVAGSWYVKISTENGDEAYRLYRQWSDENYRSRYRLIAERVTVERQVIEGGADNA